MNNSNDRFANKELDDSAQLAELQQLFASARDQELDLTDLNFTKMVLNNLPANPERINTAHLRYDLFGTIAGGIMALLLVDFKSLFAMIWSQGVVASSTIAGGVVESVESVNSIAVMPESFVISVGTIITALLVASAASLAAWVVVEKPNNLI